MHHATNKAPTKPHCGRSQWGLTMAYQIIELALDANDNVIERKPVPHPLETRGEAVTLVESAISHYPRRGYDPKQDSWWAIAGNGDRMRFVIEGA